MDAPRPHLGIPTGWLHLGPVPSASADRCANFPSREALASGDKFLGPHGEIFLWNKEKETLGVLCICPYSSRDTAQNLRWPWALTWDSRVGF